MRRVAEVLARVMLGRFLPLRVKVQGKVGTVGCLGYTFLSALRKQDFKARRSFLADFRNHGRFLSSTLEHKTFTF